MFSNKELIDYNKRKHDQIAVTDGSLSYDSRHIEIFNHTEQHRLSTALRRALALRKTQNARFLDFGCGTGNLTGKLIAPDREVWATDVSGGMCDLVRRRFIAASERGELKTETLTGEFPLPFPDNHFGFVATYSVLHHVPDYQMAVRELARVVDHGGVLFIDHESSPDNWNTPFGVRLYRFLRRPYWGIPRILERLTGKNSGNNPAHLPSSVDLPEEGDIHIFPDDHIEWDVIEQIASKAGISQISTKDYLACNEPGRLPVRHWICRGLGNDTRLFIGVKE